MTDEPRRKGRPPRGERAKPVQLVQSLTRGLRILTAFSEERSALSLTAVADRVGIPLPTAFRLAATLVEEGYLERLPDGRYRPGPAVLMLGFSALQGSDLVGICQPALQRLATETDQTVNLGVLHGAEVIYLARIRKGVGLVTANVHVGTRLPAVYASMGKAMLAYLDEDELEALLADVLFGEPGWGPNAVQSADELRIQLARVRVDGYAVQDEEIAGGLRSVAALVRDGSGDVAAAVNVAVNTSRYSVERMLDDVTPLLLRACDDMSRLLGSSGR